MSPLLDRATRDTDREFDADTLALQRAFLERKPKRRLSPMGLVVLAVVAVCVVGAANGVLMGLLS